MLLKGKTALVTGSTSGIGLACARALAAEGADIMLNGFGDPQAIESLRSELEGTGVRVRYSGADLTKAEAIEQLMAQALDEPGGVDILINNAGMQHVAPIDQFPVEKWDLILALNLSAAFHTIRLALPAMKEKGWGRIINTASAHSLVASPNKAPYVAAKHGIAGLTKAVALETATSGVTANSSPPSRPRSSSQSTRSPPSPSSSAATKPPQSPERTCRWTAAGLRPKLGPGGEREEPDEVCLPYPRRRACTCRLRVSRGSADKHCCRDGSRLADHRHRA
jgi:3-hydroxybutyrate dehydrogenase